ncbi:MAG: DNA polymerase [Candidatus Aenigmatarchaeota archaeon]
MECEKCPLNGRTKINRYPYRQYDVMVIFEYPYTNEYQYSKREQYIRNILGNDKDIYFTYAVKCNAPFESLDAVKCCNSTLQEEINICNPKYILAIGNYSFFAIFNKKKPYTKMRGKISEYNGIKILLTYSFEDITKAGPFNDTNTKYIMFNNDLALFKRTLEGDKIELNANVKPWDGMKSIFKGKVLGLDAEWDKDENCLVFSISDGFETRYITKTQKLRDMLTIGKNIFYDRYVVVANRPADERILKQNFCYIPNNARFIDIFNIARLLDDNMDISLENIVDRWLGTLKIKEAKKGKKFEEMTMEELIEYNAIDSKYTALAFYKMYKELVKDAKLLNYWRNFILPVEDMLAKVSAQGFYIDREQLQENIQTLEKEITKLELELINMVSPTIREKHMSKGLSFTRDDFVRDILINQFQIQPNKLTESGKMSVSADALKDYEHIDFVSKLLLLKKLQKLNNTFLKGLDKNIKKDSKIYPNIVLWATKTGRTACFNPNLQQVPRDMPRIELLKDLYKAPDGWLMGARDLSTSEIRIMGWLARETKILKALYEGVDIHKLTASMIVGKKIEDVSKEERQLAKAVNFGFLYGASAKTFMEYAKNNYGVEISLREAEKFREKFFEYYSNIPVFHEYVRKKVYENGYIRSPLGRMRRLPHIYSDDDYIRGQAVRQAINFPIQSFSSDLALIGMYLFWKEVKDKDDIQVLWFIHDSIFFMCKEEKFKDYMALLKYCMEQKSVEYIKEKFNVKVGYPIVSEGKVGKTWHRMEDYKDES